VTLPDLARRRRVAEDIIRAAGKLASAHFANRSALAIDRKGAQDLVSAADREAEAFIVSALGREFPEDGVLGEEGASRGLDAAAVWVIDPIDGTRNFLTGVPFWCISIGLYAGGRSVLGLIYHPAEDELFAAQEGGGAVVNGVTMRVSGETDITRARVDLSFSNRESPAKHAEALGALLKAGGEYARLGSGALGLAYVAAGRFDAFWGGAFNSWDAAAGLCLVTEAGGTVSDFYANDGLTRGNAILAATPGLTDTVSRLVGFGA